MILIHYVIAVIIAFNEYLQTIQAYAVRVNNNDNVKLILPKNVAFNQARMLESLLEQLEKFSYSKSTNELSISSAQIRLVNQEIQLLSNELYERIENLDDRARLLMSLIIPINRYFQLADDDDTIDSTSILKSNEFKKKYLEQVNLVYKIFRPIYMKKQDLLSEYNFNDDDVSIKFKNLIDSLMDSKNSLPLTKELILIAIDAYNSMLDQCNHIITNTTSFIAENSAQKLITILNYVDQRSIRVLAKKVFPRLRFFTNDNLSKSELNQLKHAYQSQFRKQIKV